MTCSRVFCIRVDPLYVEKDRARVWHRTDLIPTLCVCDFTPEVLQKIELLRSVLRDNGLSVVSQKVESVEWFHKTTKRFHLDITTLMNVTEATVYFSGWHSPYKSPSFQSSELPLADVIDSAKQFTNIDLADIRQPIPSGLIEEIKRKGKELYKRDEMHSSLIELQDSILKVDNYSLRFIDTDVELLCGSLLKEVSNQSALIKQAQNEIDELNQRLLRRCFGVGLGDRIVCDGSDYNSKRVQLQLEEVYYYENKLWLSGPRITQQGEVGKRTETIAISIFPDEHPE